MDVAGIPVRNQSFGGRELESPMKRKPFSPISTPAKTTTTNNTTTNLPEDPNKDVAQKALPPTFSHIMPFATPTKTTSSVIAAEEENKTPRAFPIPVPTTPYTASIPMHTSMTPGVPNLMIPYAPSKVDEVVAEEVEYSFEERRAGYYVISKSSMLQV